MHMYINIYIHIWIYLQHPTNLSPQYNAARTSQAPIQAPPRAPKTTLGPNSLGSPRSHHDGGGGPYGVGAHTPLWALRLFLIYNIMIHSWYKKRMVFLVECVVFLLLSGFRVVIFAKYGLSGLLYRISYSNTWFSYWNTWFSYRCWGPPAKGPVAAQAVKA